MLSGSALVLSRGQDQLIQAYESAERALGKLSALYDQTSAPAVVGQVRAEVTALLHLSSFFLSNSRHERKVCELLLQLFRAIASTLLERWSHSAECVVVLAPCLFELYSASHHGEAEGLPLQQIILVSKLLFMLSKEAANDSAFCDVQYVEAALDAIAKISDAAQDPKAKKRVSGSGAKRALGDDEPLYLDASRPVFPLRVLIYVAGTLKNTSTAEDKMLKLLATNGAVTVLSDTLRWRASDGVQAKEVAQFLIQTTGALRNLSVMKSYHKQFLEAHVPPRLCAIVPAFLGHMELMGNLSRILSKLTLHELPRAQINQNMVANMRSLVAVVDCAQNESLSFSEQQRPESRFQDVLLIRMFFVLGNLCAGNDRNRRCVAFDCRGGVDVLLRALQFYARQYVNSYPGNSSTEAQDESGEAKSGEVLVKLARVLANLAINPEVGAELNQSSSKMAILLETLALAQRNSDEELMLNIVSCITNLSYYSSPAAEEHGAPAASFIESNRLEITALLSKILLDRNEEAVVEAARAFGNLTRFKDVLARLSEHRVLDCFVVLLDHSNREIVYTVCGVLMNAALDEPTRQQLLRVELECASSAGGGQAGDSSRADVRTLLLGVVECAATDDVDMACIACKALYNLLLPAEGKSGRHSRRSASESRVCGFDSFNLRQVVQQLARAMDARDSRQTAARRLKVRAHTPKERRGGNDAKDIDGGDDDDAGKEENDEEDEAECNGGAWQELRLVLSQLLRTAASE
ncbi:hypothetical protein PybrP1_009415 [[Pythium] brassicae (nom. inval.)]|nr:hypothetical protein PybrP1_009415 [[Pythium] brassicae (nom. inval.)]